MHGFITNAMNRSFIGIGQPANVSHIGGVVIKQIIINQSYAIDDLQICYTV